MGILFLGTKTDSNPSRVPIQTTLQPLAIKFLATANPGKICPPVPPAAIKIVFCKFSKLF